MKKGGLLERFCKATIGKLLVPLDRFELGMLRDELMRDEDALDSLLGAEPDSAFLEHHKSLVEQEKALSAALGVPSMYGQPPFGPSAPAL